MPKINREMRFRKLSGQDFQSVLTFAVSSFYLCMHACYRDSAMNVCDGPMSDFIRRNMHMPDSARFGLCL